MVSLSGKLWRERGRIVKEERDSLNDGRFGGEEGDLRR
jgi:hypothetical protein